MTMDIYILRDGKEIGPLSEVTTQTLLKQGSVLINDLAWRPGMPKWIPLHSVLYPAPPVPAAPEEAAPVIDAGPAPEPPSARQRAFLQFMAIPFPADFSREQAALAINDAMEDPKLAERLGRWNHERLALHPDLFTAEIEALKEARPAQYLEIAQKEGAAYFEKITKAHCQVLVSYLDKRFPNWDAKPSEAARSYFFPAIAEKFPALLTKAAKGKFAYPKGGKAAPEISRQAGKSAPSRSAAKNPPKPFAAAFRGLLIGVVILAAFAIGNEGLKRYKAAQTAAAAEAAAIAAAPKVPTAPAAPAANQPRIAAVAPAPKTPVEETAPAAPDPAMTAPAVPVELAPAPVEALPAPPKTTALITKPVDVQLPFGRAVLRPGMQFKIVSRSATHLTVLYGKDSILVPISSTDAAAVPAPGTAPLAAPATAPTAPAAAPAASPASLF